MIEYSVSRVYENLFIGGAPPGGDFLSQNKIDCVILTANDHQDASIYKDIEVILAGGWDSDHWPIPEEHLSKWKQAADIVVDRLRNGKKVLVTCMMGQNRSGLVTAMAMQKLLGKEHSAEIVKHIQTYRKNALNNKHYVRYLLEI